MEQPSPEPKIRVYLVDDHRVVRSGLKVLVDAQPDMEVVGEADDGLAAVQGVTEAKPHVVVMDLSMPKLGGAEATGRITAADPSVRVLALTAHEERGYVQLLLTAGASGYVLKRAAVEELVQAIRAIASGGVYLDPSVAIHLVGDLPPARTGRSNTQLSEREAEVLRMIAEGHAMKEIASTLTISTRTLETYRSRAMEKLDLKTRAEIVRYALQRGWLKDG